MPISFRRLAASTCTIASLGACGGNDSSPPTPSTAPAPEAKLVRIRFVTDSVVIRRHNTDVVPTVYGYYYARTDSSVLHNVTLVSQDTTITTVNNGLNSLTAVSNGTTTVTATADGGVVAALKVTVRPAFYIKLSPMNACLRVKLPGGVVNTVQYSVALYDSTKTIVLPLEPVTRWVVDDTTIATFSPSGFLQAKNKVGETYVHAAVRDEVGDGYVVTDDHPMGTAMTCDGKPYAGGAPALRNPDVFLEIGGSSELVKAWPNPRVPRSSVKAR